MKAPSFFEIITSIGYMPIDQDTANIFFQLIAKRYEKNSTIITTNMPFSKWGDFFGSATLANAVLDRLLHHSTIISIKGPSYRIKDVRSLIETQAAEEKQKHTLLFSTFPTFLY